MKILVDHGSAHNLGDTAMLESVVGRLLSDPSGFELHVLDRPRLRTRLWDWPRVERVAADLPQPRLQAHGRVPYLWRHDRELNDLWGLASYASLGRWTGAGGVRIEADGGAVLLDEWCRGFDGYFVAGGGNLTDQFGPQLWRRCCLIQAFASQGKPIVLTGQQIGPWASRIKGATLRRALRKVDFLGLREPTDSLDYCRISGLPPGRYAVMGDDSFGIKAAPAGPVQALLSRYGLSPGGFLAANLRVAPYAASHGDQLGEVAALVRAMWRSYGLPIVAVPIAFNEEDSDIRSGYRLAELVGGDYFRVLDEPDLTPELIKGFLGRAFAAIGVSYHFCTFSLAEGVPAVCIHHGDYYSQKARGLARFWGDERLAQPLGRVDPESASRRACSLFEDARFRDKLRTDAESAVRRWEAIFDAQALGALARPAGAPARPGSRPAIAPGGGR